MLKLEKRPPSPPKIIIYSEAGIGKTTFASQAPNPIFLCTEDGIGYLNVDNTPVIKKYNDLVDYLYQLINEPHTYKTVVIDTLDHLEILIHKKVCDVAKVNSIEEIGYGRGYVDATLYWQFIMSLLNELNKTKKMVVILICHSEIKRFDDPSSESYDRYQLKLNKRASAYMVESVDCLLFACQKALVHRDKNNKTKAVGSDRVMLATGQPSYLAKNRYSLPDELPLDFNILYKQINQKLNGRTTKNEPLTGSTNV